MRVLIVGCGYVGLRAARRLAAKGREVFATTRKPERAEAFAALGLRPVRYDVLDPQGSDPLPEVDAVAHAVGYDRSTGASMERIYVGGLAGLLERLPKSVRRLVHVSSTSVHGAGEGETVDESSPTVPSTDAGRVVLAAEAAAAAWGGSTSILRCSGLYGPGRLINKAAILAGTPIASDPEGFLNLVHGDDAAAAVVAALEHPEPPPVVLVSDDRPIRRREFYDLLARTLGAPAPVFAADQTRNEGRRASNTLLKRTLLPRLEFPDIRTGVPASVAAERSGP